MISSNPHPCWTTRGHFDDEDGFAHWDTETEALRIVIRQFTEDPAAPGELPGRFTAPCWVVHCDGLWCGETLVDLEWESILHFDTAQGAVDELQRQRVALDGEGWVMTPDGLTWCSACRSEDLDLTPAPPNREEQIAAGQQDLFAMEATQ